MGASPSSNVPLVLNLFFQRTGWGFFFQNGARLKPRRSAVAIRHCISSHFSVSPRFTAYMVQTATGGGARLLTVLLS